MDQLTIYLLINIATVVVAVLVTFFITKSTTRNYVMRIAEAEFAKREFGLRKEAVQEHKADDGYKAKLDNEYLRGKADGIAEELASFTIRYQPYVDKNETFWDKSVEVGIEMEIFHHGLPIAQPMRRKTHHEKKFKDENVKLIIDSVNNTIDKIAEIAIGKSIPVKIDRKATEKTIK